jgi:large subunit ribosomal protein L19
MIARSLHTAGIVVIDEGQTFMTNALMASLQPELKSDFPDIAPGDTVRVHQKIVEGRNERIQVFQGVVIAMRGGKSAGATYTVRRTGSHGVGVERTFPLYSTTVDKVEARRVSAAHSCTTCASARASRPACARSASSRSRRSLISLPSNAGSTGAGVFFCP